MNISDSFFGESLMPLTASSDQDQATIASNPHSRTHAHSRYKLREKRRLSRWHCSLASPYNSPQSTS